MPMSVLIVDDSIAVRTALRDFFETLTDWKIGGEAKDGTEAAQKALELKPELIILNCSMPNMNGLEAASVIKKMLPNVYIIVFTMFDYALGARLSSPAGVDLIIPKAEGLTALMKAVQKFVGMPGPIGLQPKAARSGPGALEQT
jgi:two-component system, NarL family, response regulator NreC